MLLPKLLHDMINKQINMEFFSAYLYLGLAAKCEQLHYRGAAQWLRAQAAEEKEHAMRFFEFLVDYDVPVTLMPIEAPNVEPKSLLEVFELSLAHEQKVSKSIEEIFAAVIEQKAFSAFQLLSWFMNEQIEEEKTVRNIVRTLQVIKDDVPTLIDFDRQLGSRASRNS